MFQMEVDPKTQESMNTIRGLNSECAETGPAKPKQPLTAYNLFFQVERKRIIEGTDHLHLEIDPEELQLIISEHKCKGKRIHRKTHGKIGFRELARTIAARWKKIDINTKNVLEKQAAIEKEEYEKNFSIWKAATHQEDQDPAMAEEFMTTMPVAEQTLQSCFPTVLHENPLKAFKLSQEYDFYQQKEMKLKRLRELRSRIQAEMARLARTDTSLLSERSSIPNHSGIQSSLQVMRESRKRDQYSQYLSTKKEGHLDKGLEVSNNFDMDEFQTESMISSPIFKQASREGFDLLDAIHPSVMEQLFMNE